MVDAWCKAAKNNASPAAMHKLLQVPIFMALVLQKPAIISSGNTCSKTASLCLHAAHSMGVAPCWANPSRGLLCMADRHHAQLITRQVYTTWPHMAHMLQECQAFVQWADKTKLRLLLLWQPWLLVQTHYASPAIFAIVTYFELCHAP